MKLIQASQHLEILNRIFERNDLQFEIIEKLSDLMEDLTYSMNKYNKLYMKILQDNYTQKTDEKGQNYFEIKDGINRENLNNETEKLNNLEKNIEKHNIDKIDNISTKEYLCLKEFFNIT